MRRSLLARWSVWVASVAAAVLGVTVSVAPAQAITHGDLDGDGHPYVGFMIAKDSAGNPLRVCTGTLLSPTVFLTAGHCVQAPAVTADIWFDPDLTDVAANNLPFSGDARGTTHTHPDYDPSDFPFRDLGVVVLDEPKVLDAYGALPTLNAFDTWQTKRGLQDTTFTTVGYGVQRMFPDAASRKIEYQRLRMVATPRLVQMSSTATGDFSLVLSANANTGGPCNGDSGGPNFVGTSNVVAAVTSSGVNDLCRGTAGVFRLDRSWSLDWVNGFLTP
jgi:secreted trypsin-like serine protease